MMNQVAPRSQAPVFSLLFHSSSPRSCQALILTNFITTLQGDDQLAYLNLIDLAFPTLGLIGIWRWENGVKHCPPDFDGVLVVRRLFPLLREGLWSVCLFFSFLVVVVFCFVFCFAFCFLRLFSSLLSRSCSFRVV